MIKEEDIQEYINQQVNSILIPTISDYVRIPNQSRAFDKDWETDGLNEKVIDYALDFAKKLEIENMEYKIIKEEHRTPAIIVTITPPNYEKTILLYGHLDKQPPMTDQWTKTTPYDPKLIENKLYGRGAADDGYAFFSCAFLAKTSQKFNVLKNKLILFFETDEESGSKDLLYYLNKEKDFIGTPNLVICLDSGCVDYEHLCMTTSLRGMLRFRLKVSVLSSAIHSGIGSGIVPDSFRIGRSLIDLFESKENGIILTEDLYVQIPEDKYTQATSLLKELGGKIDWKFPFLNGVQPTCKDPLQQYLNRSWIPQLTLIGIDGIPNKNNASNVVRPFTTFDLSIRLPPTLDNKKAEKIIINFFTNQKSICNAKIEIEIVSSGSGFNAKTYDEHLDNIIKEAGKNSFNKIPLMIFEGGSIPFVNELAKIFTESDFIVSGLLGPESNAHGPDEFLEVDYLKKLLYSIFIIINEY